MNSGGVLQKGLEALDIALCSSVQQKLLAFGQLLLKWNKIYNLTAIRHPDEVLSLHLLDSLVVLPYLKGVGHLVDVGSGGGLPGIPLAIASPEMDVTSIETVNKKAAFQQQAKIELGLKNFNILNQRVEQVVLEKKADVVISRAFSNLSDFEKLAGHLVIPAGRMFAMKGVYPEAEIADLPVGWKVCETVMLKIPDIDVERHLVVLVREEV